MVEHSEKIGTILANIHSVDFSELGITEEPDESRTNIDWIFYIKQGREKNAVWCNLLDDNIDCLNSCYEKAWGWNGKISCQDSSLL